MSDPCWSLATAGGFEEYQDELAGFEIEVNLKWMQPRLFDLEAA
jgi:hypothetical protein